MVFKLDFFFQKRLKGDLFYLKEGIKLIRRQQLWIMSLKKFKEIQILILTVLEASIKGLFPCLAIGLCWGVYGLDENWMIVEFPFLSLPTPSPILPSETFMGLNHISSIQYHCSFLPDCLVDLLPYQLPPQTFPSLKLVNTLAPSSPSLQKSTPQLFLQITLIQTHLFVVCFYSWILPCVIWYGFKPFPCCLLFYFLFFSFNYFPLLTFFSNF